MKASKKGFTLAEILVAMTIVGVISAATVPMLSKHTQKSKVGPTLGRAIEQIEVGCRNMVEFANQSGNSDAIGYLIGDFNAKDLNSSDTTNKSLSEEFVNLSPGFLGLDSLDDISIDAKKFNGTAVEDSINTEIKDSKKYAFKKFDATTYVVQKTSINDAIASSVIATYYIDTNGSEKPNALGKDLFIFELQNDCRVVPYSKDGNTCKKGAITDGKTCGKQIVKDKFKVTYY